MSSLSSSGYRAYESATLVSSKQLTAFSDFRLPLDSPDHLSLEKYCQYLEDYVSHFNLQEDVDFRMKTKVTSIKRGNKEKGGHWVSFQRNVSSPTENGSQESNGSEGEKEHFTHISICSGLHVEPSVFDIPGLSKPLTSKKEVLERADSIAEAEEKRVEEEKGQSLSPSQSRILSLHSSAYSSPAILKDKSVLIMGTGETGMDLSYLAVKGGARQITLSTRSGFLSFPAVVSDFRVLGVDFDGSLPIDGLITNLFETAYVHPW